MGSGARSSRARGPRPSWRGATSAGLCGEGRCAGTERLPRLVGKGVALQLILTAEMIDAQEAYRIGLVNKVVPATELLAESEKMMRGILGMGPLAVRLAMEAVDQGLEMSLDEGLLLEANHFGLLAATHDMKEGLTAFLEKRPAKFQGR